MIKENLHTHSLIRSLRATVTIGIGILILASCSGKEQKAEETLSVEPSVVTELPKKAVSDAVLTPAGIEPIRIGMRISEILPQVENLYDSIWREEGFKANFYHFYLNGNERFTAYEFDSGVVNVVSASNRSIVVKGPSGEEMRIGDSFKKVLGLRDVNAVWQAEEEGMWCWNWRGIWFYPEEGNMPQVLEYKLGNQTSIPQASDFNDDIIIGYMGTGLPW